VFALVSIDSTESYNRLDNPRAILRRKKMRRLALAIEISPRNCRYVNEIAANDRGYAELGH